MHFQGASLEAFAKIRQPVEKVPSYNMDLMRDISVET